MGEGRRRREFPEAFKREAVERVRTSGLTIIAVAEEFGLHETVLRRWIQKFSEPGITPRRRPSASDAAGLVPGRPGGRERAAQTRVGARENGARHSKKPSRAWGPPAGEGTGCAMIGGGVERPMAFWWRVTPSKNVAHGLMRT